jgi:hypothetical protein
MKNSIFDFEQSILQCWNVCDDIKLLSEQAIERNTPLTQDEWANILIGMQSLYQLKFEKCFAEFESFCSDYHKFRKTHEIFQSARDDLK